MIKYLVVILTVFLAVMVGKYVYLVRHWLKRPLKVQIVRVVIPTSAKNLARPDLFVGDDFEPVNLLKILNKVNDKGSLSSKIKEHIEKATGTFNAQT